MLLHARRVYFIQALLDFGYHLAVGNMDEAYKAVKLISNPAVWENMAQICVKSKRLDVAEVSCSVVDSTAFIARSGFMLLWSHHERGQCLLVF